MKDTSPDLVLAMDGKVEVASTVDAMSADTVNDAPLIDAVMDVPATDASGDSLMPSDAVVRCPTLPPGEYSSPCPTGAMCEYSMTLQCDAGCSGGSYRRYECINNVWTITRRTSGAPVCYCPPPQG